PEGNAQPLRPPPHGGLGPGARSVILSAAKDLRPAAKALNRIVLVKSSDEEQATFFLFAEARLLWRHLPFRVLGSPVFCFQIFPVETDHDLSNVCWQGCY